MAIKFACHCGQHLKARETSAGRLTQCPRCGSPVAIPTRQPAHRGTDELSASMIRPAAASRGADLRSVRAAPASLTTKPHPAASSVPPVHAAERPAQRPSIQPPATKAPPSIAAPPSPASSTTPRRRRAPATLAAGSDEIRLRRIPHWWRLCGRRARHAVSLSVSFSFSLGTLPILAMLSALLGVVLAGCLRLLPESLQAPGGIIANPFLAFIGLAGLALAAYCALLLNRVLTAAARPTHGPGPLRLGLDTAFSALAVWIACFLAGPAVPAAAACVYWLRCGDPAFLDALVLAELLIPAAGYWLIALTLAATGRLRDALPTRVCETAWRLARPAALASLAACVTLAMLSAALFHAARLIHQDDPSGYLLLPAALTIAALTMAGVFRLVGGAYARWQERGQVGRAAVGVPEGQAG
jgi:hypothetical protein